MLIRFKSTDPRRGQVVRMDSRRGQELVDIGAAEIMKEDGTGRVESPTAIPNAASAPAPAPVTGAVLPAAASAAPAQSPSRSARQPRR